MTVLVTGATGLLGNNVARALLAEGRAVRCLVRDRSDVGPLDGLDVEVVRGDVRDPDAVERAVDGAALVVHAAALVRFGRTGEGELRDVNVGGTRTVVEACLRAGTRLLHVSSVDTLRWGTLSRPSDEASGPGPALAPYTVTKREAEALVLARAADGLDAVIVHPGYMLGPWDWKPSSGRLLLAVARGAGVVAPPGGNDFCHVGDVAAGALAAARSGRRGERFILSGEGLSYRDAFDLLARVTGGPRPVWTAPGPLIRLAGLAGDALGLLTGREPDFNSASARAASLPHHFSSGKARRELGYEPRPAEDAARDAWAWFRERGYA